jgi:uroporphyrinogen-III decarboxylase
VIRQERERHLTEHIPVLRSTSHNIQPDVPEENLKTMFDTFNEWREYKKLFDLRGDG